MRSRKRCPFCRCLFVPDGRVAQRQWACTKAECQKLRRQRTQNLWRQAHPQDPIARRCRQAIAEAKDGNEPQTPTGPPACVDRFPWEEVRDEISPQEFVIIRFFVRLVVALTKDEINAQVLKITGKFGKLPVVIAKDETARRAAGG